MAVCRRCGSRDVADELQWDTVIGHECCDCGYYWSIGRVGGFPGEHYFIPDMPSIDEEIDLMMSDQECMEGYEDGDECETIYDYEMMEQLGISKEALDVLVEVQGEFDDDDDLPF